MIPQQFIDEVQSRTDIAEVIASYLPLKKAGRNFKGLCPFHGEKTPSFIVSPQKQIFHCFGCGEGGGVFQFITLIEKISFPEAVELLAKRLGLDIPYQQDKNAKTKTALYEAMSVATLFFHNNLKNDKKLQGVRDYLAERGVGPETIKKFQLGYAPGNNGLMSYMRTKSFTLEILEKCSLITSRGGGFCDVFRNRITFPILDIRSRVVGFGARIHTKDTQAPKYINSLENVLYSKRNHLYGLYLAKDEISNQQTAIVVEGYLDMITPFMRGISNVVASLGTALTEEQIRLIKRYAQRVVMVYDSDKAGQNATLRSLDLLLEQGLEVEIMQLPSGSDPDSFFRNKDRADFLTFLKQARDFFDYKVDVLSNIYDKDSIDGKTKIAKEMLETIDKLPSQIKKYEYIRKLAGALSVKEEIMIAEFQKKSPVNNTRRNKFSAPGGNQSAGLNKNELLPVTEKVIFKFLLTNPKTFPLVKKNLKQEYFSSPISRKAISLFLNNSIEAGVSGPKFLGTINDKEISSFISKILIDDDIPMDKNTFKESLLKLKKKGIIQFKSELREKIRDAEAKGDTKKVKILITEFEKVNSREVKNG
ncbi:MAG: DNA primase [Candidatus Omnitrophica bacterium]|nr:DNA primase [Candidatus Omnitrophota bacterium]